MLSDFKVKLPTVGEKNLFNQNHTQSRPSRIHYSHIQDLSYCSNAFGSAVIVQIEMLKLVTEKKTHVTSLKGITCEACECIRTPVSLTGWSHVREMPNTLYLTYTSTDTVRMIRYTEGHHRIQFIPGELTPKHQNYVKREELHILADSNLKGDLINLEDCWLALCFTVSRSGGRKVVFIGEPLLRIICYIPI